MCRWRPRTPPLTHTALPSLLYGYTTGRPLVGTADLTPSRSSLAYWPALLSYCVKYFGQPLVDVVDLTAFSLPSRLPGPAALIFCTDVAPSTNVAPTVGTVLVVLLLLYYLQYCTSTQSSSWKGHCTVRCTLLYTLFHVPCESTPCATILPFKVEV
jgi:hypothetical protein